jgi:hypothetical protein
MARPRPCCMPPLSVSTESAVASAEVLLSRLVCGSAPKSSTSATCSSPKAVGLLQRLGSQKLLL